MRSRAPRQIARRKIDLLVYRSDDAVRVVTALNMGKEGGIFPRFEKVLEQGRDARATGTERSCLTYSTWFVRVVLDALDVFESADPTSNDWLLRQRSALERVARHTGQGSKRRLLDVLIKQRSQLMTYGIKPPWPNP
ncbi:hypothetical protein [Bradyrhizobium sp. USDA 4449]